jgi:hypothetical protein
MNGERFLSNHPPRYVKAHHIFMNFKQYVMRKQPSAKPCEPLPSKGLLEMDIQVRDGYPNSGVLDTIQTLIE